MARVWDETKAKEKAEIARVDAESMERAMVKVEAIVRQKNNDGKRAVEEAAAKIRAKLEFKKGKREREEAEARSKAEAEIKEKVEKMRKAGEAREKAKAETADRSRAWA